jgi:hypothetical protein
MWTQAQAQEDLNAQAQEEAEKESPQEEGQVGA